MTKKVLDFNSPKDHYEADACIVWCFDDRFFKLLKAFGKQEGFNRIDLVKCAGGAKALASEGGVDRDFLVSQIAASIRLHGTKRVILMVHVDCGGYGGSKAFNNDHAAEFEHHADELARASEFLSQAFPGIALESYVADFDGLHRVEHAQAVLA
jgi:carbonic anhydrase